MTREAVTGASVVENVRAALRLVQWVPEGDPSRAMAELIRDAVEALVGETNNDAAEPQEKVE